MEDSKKIYLELLENTAEASKLLVCSQLALDDGDLSLSQKHFLQAKDILATLTNDTFKEVAELANDPTDECEDYDISQLNLASLLMGACKIASTLLDIDINNPTNPTKDALLTKLVTLLNACTELYGILFN